MENTEQIDHLIFGGEEKQNYWWELPSFLNNHVMAATCNM